jgi:hypothetical protein
MDTQQIQPQQQSMPNISTSGIIRNILILVIIFYAIISVAIFIYVSLEQNQEKRENAKFIFTTLFGNNVLLTMLLLVILYISIPYIIDLAQLLTTAFSSGAEKGVEGVVSKVLSPIQGLLQNPLQGILKNLI